MTTFLQVGDVIEIKEGMKIYAEIPEKFRFANRPFSNELISGDITIGEIRQNDLGNFEQVKKQVIEEIEDIFENSIGAIPQNEIEGFVDTYIKEPKQESFDTSIFAGEYVVTSTSLTGGGADPYHRNHSYEDGHLVVCKKLKNGVFDEEGIQIQFYQSGSFNAVISAITPIRQMKVSFV